VGVGASRCVTTETCRRSRWTIFGRPRIVRTNDPPVPVRRIRARRGDPSSPDILRLLVDNHARFLGFLERPVGSRPGAYDNPGSLAYDRAVNDVLLLLDKSIVALGATYLPDIVFGGDRQPTRP
jgi:hypothetical protein